MIKITMSDYTVIESLGSIVYGSYFRIFGEYEVYRLLEGKYVAEECQVVSMGSSPMIKTLSTKTKVIVLEGSGEIFFTPKCHNSQQQQQ